MNNPEHILRTLDTKLTQPTRLILYGRAALALGFPPTTKDFASTQDVDALLPEIELPAVESDTGFWLALEEANAELEPSGLYMTHLFTDSQVILTPDWLNHLVPIPLAGLRQLRLFRPRILDLVLTKMMRVDPLDLADIRFLLLQEPMEGRLLENAFATARVPAIPEIQEAFSHNQKAVLAMV
jgi:hypothetical protein